MKHSKYLNSGFIANNVEKIIISKISNNDKTISEGFNKYVSLLKSLPLVRKELDIFEQLSLTFTDRKALGSKLLAEIKKDIQKNTWNGLTKERQIFYDKTKKIFPNLSENLEHYLKDYKLFGSIKNFIDDSIERKLNAKERLIIEENIVEALCNGNKAKDKAELIAETNQIPSEVDPLAVTLMIRSFCKKWKSILTPTQYSYIVDYASNSNNINENWTNKIKQNLNQFPLNAIDSEEVLEKTKKVINEANQKNIFNNEEILKFSELVDNLNKIKEKDENK